ncbi:hypothetical protein CIHG_08774 [Coccidioides immitis H538.4]|uniref:Uncharacterized protein n=1 Tax=Coccidioides immitis H538.4 TaxID=396776 RepID=A0A0J8UTN6_COCIT|nr:hypothetical protein CIHG_08774 [Coccidioides immitis H538.4]
MASVCAFTNWPVREHMGALERQQSFFSVNPSFQKETHTIYNISDLPDLGNSVKPRQPRPQHRGSNNSTMWKPSQALRAPPDGNPLRQETIQTLASGHPTAGAPKLLCASVKPFISTEHGVTNGWTCLRAPIMRHFPSPRNKRATGDYQSPTSSHKNFTIIGHIVPLQPGRGVKSEQAPIPVRCVALHRGWESWRRGDSGICDWLNLLQIGSVGKILRIYVAVRDPCPSIPRRTKVCDHRK